MTRVPELLILLLAFCHNSGFATIYLNCDQTGTTPIINETLLEAVPRPIVCKRRNAVISCVTNTTQMSQLLQWFDENGKPLIQFGSTSTNGQSKQFYNDTVQITLVERYSTVSFPYILTHAIAVVQDNITGVVVLRCSDGDQFLECRVISAPKPIWENTCNVSERNVRLSWEPSHCCEEYVVMLNNEEYDRTNVTYIDINLPLPNDTNNTNVTVECVDMNGEKSPPSDLLHVQSSMGILVSIEPDSIDNGFVNHSIQWKEKEPEVTSDDVLICSPEMENVFVTCSYDGETVNATLLQNGRAICNEVPLNATLTVNVTAVNRAGLSSTTSATTDILEKIYQDLLLCESEREREMQKLQICNNSLGNCSMSCNDSLGNFSTVATELQLCNVSLGNCSTQRNILIALSVFFSLLSVINLTIVLTLVCCYCCFKIQNPCKKDDYNVTEDSKKGSHPLQDISRED